MSVLLWSYAGPASETCGLSKWSSKVDVRARAIRVSRAFWVESVYRVEYGYSK